MLISTLKKHLLGVSQKMSDSLRNNDKTITSAGTNIGIGEHNHHSHKTKQQQINCSIILDRVGISVMVTNLNSIRSVRHQSSSCGNSSCVSDLTKLSQDLNT
jgi:hypothetical protein